MVGGRKKPTPAPHSKREASDGQNAPLVSAMLTTPIMPRIMERRMAPNAPNRAMMSPEQKVEAMTGRAMMERTTPICSSEYPSRPKATATRVEWVAVIEKSRLAAATIQNSRREA